MIPSYNDPHPLTPGAHLSSQLRSGMLQDNELDAVLRTASVAIGLPHRPRPIGGDAMRSTRSMIAFAGMTGRNNGRGSVGESSKVLKGNGLGDDPASLVDVFVQALQVQKLTSSGQQTESAAAELRSKRGTEAAGSRAGTVTWAPSAMKGRGGSAGSDQVVSRFGSVASGGGGNSLTVGGGGREGSTTWGRIQQALVARHASNSNAVVPVDHSLAPGSKWAVSENWACGGNDEVRQDHSGLLWWW